MYYHRSTGAGVIAATTTPSGEFQVEGLRIHFAIAPVAAGNVILSIDHVDGAVYDIVLSSVDVNGLTDHVYQAPRGHYFPAGCTIKVDYANPSTRTYGLEIVFL